MKKQQSIVSLVLFTGVFLLTTNLLAQDPNFHIYLCFGQSNMEGQGTIEAQDGIVDSRFKLLQALDCSNLNRSKATWYPAVPPTCQCWSGLSPADYFGRTMVANLPDSITVGVINVSIGGCDIRLFDKDIYQEYDSTYTESWFLDKIKGYEGNPYQYLIDLAQLAQQDGVIKGILLHQGETNTGQVVWPSYVKKIYHDMLTDLSLNADSIPLLAGEVLSAAGNCCSSMNPIINRLPDTIPTAHVISSSGCMGQDNAHFDSEGYRILGRRYAVEMLSLMGYEAVYAEAECCTVGDSCIILTDEGASNTSYVSASPGSGSTSEAPTSDASSIQIDFTVNADTSYFLYGRFDNSNTEEYSVWIKVDDDDFELYDSLTSDGWAWRELKSLNLTAGEHLISIAFTENGAKLDKLVIKNSHAPPVDMGEEAKNLCEPHIYTGGGINRKNSFDKYTLEQNYPNPFSGVTSISFEIPHACYVSIKVFDIQGVEIAELAGKDYNAGKNTVILNQEKISDGNYYYTIKTDNFCASRKMIILTR